MPNMPVQQNSAPSSVPSAIYMRAYEVYCEIFGPQVEIVTGNCRGGFGVLELIALLYARSFPKAEWRDRFREALRKNQDG
jgi:hypothetical protein